MPNENPEPYSHTGFTVLPKPETEAEAMATVGNVPRE